VRACAFVFARNLLLFPFLWQFYASNNHFLKLPAMPFPRLRHAEVGMNTLEQLPDSLHMCTSLQELDVGCVGHLGGGGDSALLGAVRIRVWVRVADLWMCACVGVWVCGCGVWGVNS
jgi:hypothetical protein